MKKKKAGRGDRLGEGGAKRGKVGEEKKGPNNNPPHRGKHTA